MKKQHYYVVPAFLGLLSIQFSHAQDSKKHGSRRTLQIMTALTQKRMQSGYFHPLSRQEIQLSTLVNQQMQEAKKGEDSYFEKQKELNLASQQDNSYFSLSSLTALYGYLPKVSGWFSKNHWKNPVIRKRSSLLVVNHKNHYVERGSTEHSFKLYDENNKEVYSFEAEQGWFFNTWLRLPTSPDQKYFYFCLFNPEQEKELLYLVDGATMKTLSSFKYRIEQSIQRFVYPDGMTPHFMIRKEDGILMYDIVRKEEKEFLVDGPSGRGHYSEEMIVIESTDKKVMLYDLKNNYAAYEIPCEKTIKCLDVRDDYCLVYVDGALKLYNKKGEIIIVPEYRQGEEIKLVYFGIRKNIFVTETNKGIYIHTGKENPLFVETTKTPVFVKFDHSGNYVCIQEGSPYGESTVHFYDIVQQKELKKLEQVRLEFKWISDTPYALLTDNNNLFVFDAKKGDFAPIMPLHSGWLTHPGEGSALVARDHADMQKATVYKFFKDRILKTDIKAEHPFDAWRELDMQWSWCGKLFGCVTEKTINVYDATSGKSLLTCERDRGRDLPSFDIYFCCKDRYFVVLSRFLPLEDRRVRIFDAQDGFKLIETLNPKDEIIDGIRFYDRDLPRNIACVVHSDDKVSSISKFYLFK